MPTVYKITYPNNKIYIGQDFTDDLNYFGSADGKLISKDFSKEHQKRFKITKEILWEGHATKKELNKIELEFILSLQSNNPKIGYNKRPKLPAATPFIS